MTTSEQRRVLVTGGTGRLGRQVVGELRQAGVTVRVLSRRPAGTDLTGPGVEWAQGEYMSGEGLGQALQDVDTVLHTAHDPAHPAADLAGVERLIGYARAAGLRRFVQVGIVGASEVPGFGYYAAKVAAEERLAQSGLRFSVFRATQFHPFVASLLAGLERLPLVLVPVGTVQPVDLGEVAAALARHILRDEPGIEELAGPDILSLPDLTRQHLAARGSGKRVVGVRLPLSALKAVAAGALTSRSAPRGQRTFAEWLAAHPHG